MLDPRGIYGFEPKLMPENARRVGQVEKHTCANTSALNPFKSRPVHDLSPG